MTRDYAKSTYNQRGRGATRIIHLLLGIMIGLAIAGTMYWCKEHSVWWHQVEKLEAKATQVVTVKPNVNEKVKPSTSTETEKNNKNSEKKTHDIELPDQPHFDFYTELPKMKVDIGEEKPVTKISSKAHSEKKTVQHTKNVVAKIAGMLSIGDADDEVASSIQQHVVKPSAEHHYILQVASFSDFNEADRIKAQLSLLGFDVALKAIHTSDGSYFRVWIGPFEDQAKALLAQRKLQRNHFKSLVMEV